MISADLTGKAALVTGAASGIGLATTEAFARNGAAVALNHLPEDPRGPREVERLKVLGWRVIAAPGDVSQPGQAERMVASAIDGLGRLDFLVNNAGTPATPTPIPFADLDAQLLVDDPEHQFDRPVPVRPCRGGGAQAGARCDLQHRLDRRRDGLGQQHPLCDEQGGADQFDKEPGTDPGAGGAGQRSGARACR